jgi:hypothetical protein
MGCGYTAEQAARGLSRCATNGRPVTFLSWDTAMAQPWTFCLLPSASPVTAALVAVLAWGHAEAGPWFTYPLSSTPSVLANGARAAAMQTENFSRLAGTWSGQIPTMKVQLEIQPSGAFHWVAVAGNARAEGAGLIQSSGSGYAILLPFLAPDPLPLKTVGSHEKMLTIVLSNGNELRLMRGVLNNQNIP